MATWGYASFQNDDAMDYLAKLSTTESDWETLARVCKDALRAHPLKETDGVKVIVAAELLAAANGKPNPDLPEDAVVWLKGRRKPQPGALKSAISALDRVLLPGSDLAATWEKSDDFGAWKAGLEGLTRRLW